MNPFSPAFVPGFAHQQSLSLIAAPNNSNTVAELTPMHASSYNSYSDPVAAHGINTLPVLSRPDRHSREKIPHAQPTVMRHPPQKPRQVEIVSPVSHRNHQPLLHKLNNFDIQGSSESSSVLAAYKKNADKVTTPSEMPIGSLVHSKEPPTWGVVKISNVSYSKGIY
jgi:hypothetical protein